MKRNKNPGNDKIYITVLKSDHTFESTEEMQRVWEKKIEDSKYCGMGFPRIDKTRKPKEFN